MENLYSLMVPLEATSFLRVLRVALENGIRSNTSSLHLTLLEGVSPEIPFPLRLARELLHRNPFLRIVNVRTIPTNPKPNNEEPKKLLVLAVVELQSAELQDLIHQLSRTTTRLPQWDHHVALGLVRADDADAAMDRLRTALLDTTICTPETVPSEIGTTAMVDSQHNDCSLRVSPEFLALLPSQQQQQVEHGVGNVGTMPRHTNGFETRIVTSHWKTIQRTMAEVPPSCVSDDDDDRNALASFSLPDLSDFVVSDEELDASSPHIGNQSQTSFATSNFLRELQQNEDTSTSFVPSVMGGDEGDHIIAEAVVPSLQDDDEIDDDEIDEDHKATSVPTKRSRAVDTMVPGSLFRYLRSLAGSNKQTESNNNHNDSSSSSDHDEEFYSSSSSSTSSWGDNNEDEGLFVEDEIMRDVVVDWNHIPALPNRFCSTKLRTPHYLDASLLNDESVLTKSDAHAFVWEHGTLLRAVLQLLAERDQVGVEGSIGATDNIWKKGSLKKLAALGLTAGTWKVKYVEIRQGNLCYYGDSGNGQRKIIHLRQADTVVQESSLRGPGLVWELNVQGTKYYWSASSEAERQSWMKAMQNAMIGDEGPRKELDLQPYQSHIMVYKELRDAVQRAVSQKEYLAAIQIAIKELASLQVPVQWVREQTEQEFSPVLLGTLKPPRFNTSPQKRLRSSIAEFWRTMGQTTFTINGLTVPRTSQLASERIVGALTRCILEYDKASIDSEERDDDGCCVGANFMISELQAVAYARDILLAVLRSRERQDIACAVKYLLDNSFVNVECTSSVDEPVHMEISFAGEDLPDDLPESVEMATWVWTRTRRNNIPVWKQRHSYAVLSGTVLSLYEAAEPRPHGLRGQVVLDSNMTVKEHGEDLNETDSLHSKNSKARHGLCITTGRSLDRLLYFEKAEDAAAWKDAIDEAITNADSIQKPPRVVTTATTVSAHATLLKGAERVIKGAADGTLQTGVRVIRGAKDGGIRVIRGATGSGLRVIKTATGAGFKVVRGAVDRLRQNKTSGDEGEAADESSQRNSDGSRRPSLDILLNNTIVHGKREPTVQCVIRTTETFSIKNQGFTEHSSERETDNTGTSTAEAWMSVEARLYQAFLMCGGPSGRIALGDALVELHFVETSVEQDDEGSC